MTTATAVRVRPMRYHGPGWIAEQDGLVFRLWAPRPGQECWKAAWADLDDECGFTTLGATLDDVLVLFRFSPDVRAAMRTVAS